MRRLVRVFDSRSRGLVSLARKLLLPQPTSGQFPSTRSLASRSDQSRRLLSRVFSGRLGQRDSFLSASVCTLKFASEVCAARLSPERVLFNQSGRVQRSKGSLVRQQATPSQFSQAWRSSPRRHSLVESKLGRTLSNRARADWLHDPVQLRYERPVMSYHP